MSDPESNIVSMLDVLLSGGTRSGSLVDAIDRLTGVLSGSMEFRTMGSGQREHVIAFNDEEQFSLRDSSSGPRLWAEGRLGNLQNATLKQSWVETEVPIALPAGSHDHAKQEYSLPFEPPNPGGFGSTRRYFFRYPADSFDAAGPTMLRTLKLDCDTTQLWIGSVGSIANGIGQFEGVRGMSVYVGSACLSGWPQTQREQVDFLRGRGVKIRVSTFMKLVLRESLDAR